MISTKRLLRYCLIGLLITLVFSCKSKIHPVVKVVGKDTLYLLTLKTFQVNNGWGYSIYVGNQIFIHQDQVPALPGKHVFTTEADAKKAGEMVVEKIKQKKMPSIDSLEMANANIHYN